MIGPNGRPCPEWFARPQLGIFIHWGMFTIPAWAPRGRAIHELHGDDYYMSAVMTPIQNGMTMPSA